MSLNFKVGINKCLYTSSLNITGLSEEEMQCYIDTMAAVYEEQGFSYLEHSKPYMDDGQIKIDLWFVYEI